MGEQDGFKGLRVTNTLTGRKEDFVPLDPMNVRMYVCGPTVYDFAHIGNARPAIVFDVLFRLLRHLYGEEHVTYVRNITDVDDKIIARAAEDYPDLPLNEAIGKVTATTEKQYHEDVAALGCLPPTAEPRATEHIVEMVAMIEALAGEGHAYAADGHVLFDVKSWKAADGSLAYGKLSRRSLDDMIAGARVEVAPYKHDPMDFVLWKPSKPGEPAWPSPWGEGRPGWHIECSAMAKKHLGDTFDIHGGGIDLVFPHHENEIAQSRVANHTDAMARYWMHNGFLQVEGRKMAKSEGNFVTIRELLRGWQGRPWSGPVLRLAMLYSHYRQPIDWTLQRLEEARAEVHRWATALDARQHQDRAKWLEFWEEHTLDPFDDVVKALSDDLNVGEAVAFLRSQLDSVESDDIEKGRRFLHSVRLLGLFTRSQVRAVQAGWQVSWSSAVPRRPIPLDRVARARALQANLSAFRANDDAECIASATRELAEIGFDTEIDGAGGVTLRYAGPESGPTVDYMVSARAAARKAKNFAEADRIRDELDAMGIQLKDAKDPKTGELVTTWEVKR